MKRARKTGYTLVEVLVVIAIFATLISAATRLFGDAWTSIHRATTHIQTAQTVRLVADRWRAVVRETSPGDWQTANGQFNAGNQRVFFDSRHVVFGNGKTERRIHLPGSLTGQFSIEKKKTGVDCAVLTLAWERRYFRVTKTESIRVAGCARGGIAQ